MLSHWGLVLWAGLCHESLSILYRLLTKYKVFATPTRAMRSVLQALYLHTKPTAPMLSHWGLVLWEIEDLNL